MRTLRKEIVFIKLIKFLWVLFFHSLCVLCGLNSFGREISVCLAGSVGRLPIAGSSAPDFTLKGLNAKEVALRDYKGKVVLLNFWATWCVPCRKEMPSMERIYRDYKDQGFEILAISIDKKESKVKSFIEEQGFTFAVLLDASHKIKEVYGISAIPRSFLIDRKGVIDRVIFGAYDWESFLSRRLIEDLLMNR